MTSNASNGLWHFFAMLKCRNIIYFYIKFTTYIDQIINKGLLCTDLIEVWHLYMYFVHVHNKRCPSLYAIWLTMTLWVRRGTPIVNKTLMSVLYFTRQLYNQYSNSRGNNVWSTRTLASNPYSQCRLVNNRYVVGKICTHVNFFHLSKHTHEHEAIYQQCMCYTNESTNDVISVNQHKLPTDKSKV